MYVRNLTVVQNSVVLKRDTIASRIDEFFDRQNPMDSFEDMFDHFWNLVNSNAKCRTEPRVKRFLDVLDSVCCSVHLSSVSCCLRFVGRSTLFYSVAWHM